MPMLLVKTVVPYGYAEQTAGAAIKILAPFVAVGMAMLPVFVVLTVSIAGDVHVPPVFDNVTLIEVFGGNPEPGLSTATKFVGS